MPVSLSHPIIEKYLPRTMYLVDIINLKIEISDAFDIKENEPASFNHFSRYFLNLIDSNSEKNIATILKELLAIETEKYELKSTAEERKTILNFEDQLDSVRNQLLSEHEQSFLEKKLHVSPYIHTYESHYRWILEENDVMKFDIAQNLEASPGDFYFLFQKIGYYDELLNSNIFEFPLNQYQYLLLQLFEQPLIVEEAIAEFMLRFDIATVKEEEQLKVLSLNLIKNLLFRKFIFLNDTMKKA